MSEEKLSWEEMMATEPDLIGFNSNSVKRIVERAIEEEREKWKKAVEFFKKYQYVPEYFIRQNPKYLKQVLNVCLCKNKKDLSKLKKGAIVLYDTWLFELASKDLVKG